MECERWHLVSFYSKDFNFPLYSIYNVIFIYIIIGGGERIRTDDLLRARQALSQLSYTPF